ncbi:MAG TPA: O-phosphoserine--tRNA ligase [Hadesarchaea archaeon]|nr:O-phosphoserine--tRNA ligase [Hadesarchaea archaeon]
MRFDTAKITTAARKDYEATWLETADLIKKEGRFFSLQGKGRPNELQELIAKMRRILLQLGFNEVSVPTIIDKKEIIAQYGPEAPVILDRLFFLAGLDRPDIGISRKKIQEIRKIVPDFNKVKELQGIFRRYKQSEISSDDLVEILVKELGLKEEQAGGILSLFSEFQKLKPIPTDLTLRSHTTAGWFSVLKETLKREPLPLQLFSIGQKFRREQRLDPTHLYESWTASIVIAAEEISLEDGQRITREILSRIGFDHVKFSIKLATSKYYAPRTEFEVFVEHPKTGEMIEVGDAGFYSPVPLSNYDIAYPVFNLGIGLERVLMVRIGETDIRALAYPYLYKKAKFSDAELSKMIRIARSPGTSTGKMIAAAIFRTARKHADEPSPCEFKAFEGKLLGKHVRVRVVEPEGKTKLVGPAGFNEVYVSDGNVVGVPPRGWVKDEFLGKVRKQGVPTGINYMDAFANLAAREIERAAERGERAVKTRARNVKLPSDINLAIDKVAQRYITANKKRIDVRGPVFTTVVAEIR